MTAQEFVKKKINPRITAEYDISLTGQQLFDLLDEYAAIAKAMPETTELKIKCTHPRESRQYIGRNMLRCGICGYEFE